MGVRKVLKAEEWEDREVAALLTLFAFSTLAFLEECEGAKKCVF